MFSREAVILLKDIQGEKTLGILESFFKSNARPVHQGELLLGLPKAQVVSRKDGKPSHNYKLANDFDVTLFCTEHDVAPLSDHEYHLMEAVKSRQTRYGLFQKDMLDWGTKVKEGNIVRVTLPSKTPASSRSAVSVIRYVGPLPNEPGIKFGVEICVSNY